jgi:hypothetical protein
LSYVGVFVLALAVWWCKLDKDEGVSRFTKKTFGKIIKKKKQIQRSSMWKEYIYSRFKWYVRKDGDILSTWIKQKRHEKNVRAVH